MGQQVGCLLREEKDKTETPRKVRPGSVSDFQLGGEEPRSYCDKLFSGQDACWRRSDKATSKATRKSTSFCQGDDPMLASELSTSMAFGSEPSSSLEVQALRSQLFAAQVSMRSLRTENDRLCHINEGLERDNIMLRTSIADQSTSRLWKTFDVVELHYKQLERQRQRRISGGGLSCGDSGGSACTSPRDTFVDKRGSIGGVQMYAMDSCLSSPQTEKDEDPIDSLPYIEGVLSKSLATPRTPRTTYPNSSCTTPMHSQREHERLEAALSHVPQSPDATSRSFATAGPKKTPEKTARVTIHEKLPKLCMKDTIPKGGKVSHAADAHDVFASPRDMVTVTPAKSEK